MLAKYFVFKAQNQFKSEEEETSYQELLDEYDFDDENVQADNESVKENDYSLVINKNTDDQNLELDNTSATGPGLNQNPGLDNNNDGLSLELDNAMHQVESILLVERRVSGKM